MLDHVSIGVRDLAAARRFYEAARAPLGGKCLYDSDTVLGFGTERPVFWLNLTERPVAADPASGLHVCFAAPSEASVAAFHRAALGAGGRDNGAPGLRPDYGPGYYAAFVVDPDGYRVEAYCALPAS